MLPDDSGLTVKELKEELRKFQGANLGGNKAQLLSRLTEYRQVAEQAATFALTSAGVVDDTVSSAGIITPATKTSGRASPVRDTTTPLRKGEALEALLFRRPAKLHPITIQCLITLKATPWLLKPLDAPDPRLEAQLQPLLALCKTLQQQAGRIELVSSHSTNVGRLISIVSSEFQDTASTMITAELDPCVRRLIDVVAAGEEGIADLRKPEFVRDPTERGIGGTAREEDDVGEDDRDLQKAIEESVLDQRQREMREGYESDLAAAGGAGAGVVSGVSAAGDLSGGTVADTRMEGTEEGRVAADIITRFPTDNDVRQAVATAGPAGIDPLDLIKVVNVRDLGLEAVQVFERGIVERGVVERAPNGHFVLAQGPPRTDILAMAPTLLPTPTRPEASLAGPPTPRVLSSIPGLELEVARIRDGILAFFRSWAEDFPEATEGHWPIDFDTKERSKVRKYVTAILQNSDLATEGDADGTKTPAIIQNLLADAQFPVQKAKNEAALQAVIKELLYNLRRASGAKSVEGGDGDGAAAPVEIVEGGEVGAAAAQSETVEGTGEGTGVGTATLGAGAGTKRGREEEDEEDDDEGGDEIQRSPRKKR